MNNPPGGDTFDQSTMPGRYSADLVRPRAGLNTYTPDEIIASSSDRRKCALRAYSVQSADGVELYRSSPSSDEAGPRIAQRGAGLILAPIVDRAPVPVHVAVNRRAASAAVDRGAASGTRGLRSGLRALPPSHRRSASEAVDWAAVRHRPVYGRSTSNRQLAAASLRSVTRGGSTRSADAKPKNNFAAASENNVRANLHSTDACTDTAWKLGCRSFPPYVTSCGKQEPVFRWFYGGFSGAQRENPLCHLINCDSLIWDFGHPVTKTLNAQHDAQ